MTGSSSLSLSVFCHIEPYPATNGAAVDMSRRLEALKSLGIRLQVIVWQCEGEEPSQKLEKALHSVASVFNVKGLLFAGNSSDPPG